MKKVIKRMSVIGTITTVIILINVVFVMVLFFIFIAKNSNDERQLELIEDKVQSELAFNQLNNGSDILTEAIRNYVVTGNEKFLNDFNTELEVTQNREKAIEIIEELDDIKQHLHYLEDALSASNELAEVEMDAIDYIADGDFSSAQALIFSDNYLEYKVEIRKNTQLFQSESRQTILDLETAVNESDANYNMLTAITSSIYGISMLFIIFFTYKQRQNSKDIRELATSLESAAIGIIITDSSGRIEYANREFTEMSGYSKTELTGTFVSSLQKNKKMDREYDSVEKIINKYGTINQEVLHQRKDGTTYWVKSIVNPIIDDRGITDKYVSSYEDITNDKRNSTFDKAVHQMMIDVFQIDNLRNRLLLITKTIVKGFNIKIARLKIENIHSGEQYEVNSVDESIEKTRELKRNILVTNIFDHHTKENNASQIKYITEYIALYKLDHYLKREIRNIDGTLIGVIEIINDSDLDETYQRKLDNIAGTTSQVVDASLSQAEMKRAKELAEISAQTRSDFLANMSHEIRTPMNAIIGLSQLLGSTKLNVKQKDYVQKTLLSAKNLLRIINDILDLSKMDAGKLLLESVPFSLEEILNNVITVSTFKASDKGIELVVLKDPDIPQNLQGDPLRISQILLNLLSNGVKFTEEGYVALEVTKVQHTANDVTLRFIVSDTGVGIAKEKVKTLFDAFTQEDTSTSRKYGGTGLGLSISASLVHAMGGQISVKTEKGKGSTFHFDLTFKISKDENKKPVKIIPNEIQELKVLLVDDIAITREAIGFIMSNLGFDVDVVSNGKDAIPLLTENKYDLALIDWKMPGMNGIELIKQITKNKDTHYVMITAHGDKALHQEALDSGFDKVIIKPILESKIYNEILDLYHIEIKNGLKDHVFKDQFEDYDRELSILVVEDNEVNQLVIKDVLEKQNMKVVIAENGLIALEAFKDTSFDLILMDIQMPVMDGYEASIEIRKRDIKTPIIALTADVVEGVREKALDAGMNSFVTKPIDLTKLFDVMREFIAFDDLSKNKKKEELSFNLTDVNTNKALALLAGNVKLYMQLLDHFEKQYRSMRLDLIKLKSKKDFATHFHTLKGLLGNVGSSKGYKMALQAEEYFKDEKNKIKDFDFDDINALIQLLCIEIVESRHHFNTFGILSKELLLQKLDAMKLQLSQYSTDVLDVIDEIKDSLLYYNKETQQFIDFVNDLQFTKSLEIIDSVMTQITEYTEK